MFKRTSGLLAMTLLASFFLVQAPAPATAGWWDWACFWCEPEPELPTAEELIEERSNLDRLPQVERDELEWIIEKYRENGAPEADVERFLDDLDREYSSSGIFHKLVNELVFSPALASENCRGKKKAALLLCHAREWLGGSDSQTKPKPRKNTEDSVKKRLSGPRYQPGTAHFGNGYGLPLIKAGQKWLRGTEGNAGKIPLQIAQKLSGKRFRNFDHFREEFWLAVSKDPVLLNQFSTRNQALIRKGRAPFALPSQQVGKRQRYELDHIRGIAQGGGVYDMQNIAIRSPLNHLRGK